MGERTARDVLVAVLIPATGRSHAVDIMLANRAAVLAALVESGGPLTDDELRAARAVPVMAERTLNRGDRIEATPCVVTIEDVGAGGYAFGHCAHCDDTHFVNRQKYLDGGGPWRRAAPDTGGAPNGP